MIMATMCGSNNQLIIITNTVQHVGNKCCIYDIVTWESIKSVQLNLRGTSEGQNSY